jgi:serine protease DegS
MIARAHAPLRGLAPALSRIVHAQGFALFGWPLLTGVLIAMLIIQRFPQWVGLPSQDVNLQQAPQTTRIMQGPVSYADAVTLAAPAVVNLYTTKVVNKAPTRCSKTRSSAVSSATTCPSSAAGSRAWARR